MFRNLKAFALDESGAVTIDWVVLTAGIVGLAIAAWTQIDQSTRDLHVATADAINTQSVN
ncbi:MAG TPA: hypothetical protein VJ928_03820 [Marivita sp.]|nr:hypothetical protein [Marivita sp.]